MNCDDDLVLVYFCVYNFQVKIAHEKANDDREL